MVKCSSGLSRCVMVICFGEGDLGISSHMAVASLGFKLMIY